MAKIFQIIILIIFSLLLMSSSCDKGSEVCTDPIACNYDDTATIECQEIEINDCCEYIPEEFNLITPENGSVITFDENSYLTTFIDFSWEPSEDLNVDDLISYELNVIDVSEGEVIFNQITNDLNFVVPVYILFEEPTINEEMFFNWNVTATDNSEFEYSIECTIPFSFSLYYEGTSAIGDENIPEYYELGDSYPNPFNPITYIEYALPESGFITLSVYNINGKLIEVLESGNKLAGYYQVYWNATNAPSGTYFITFTSQKYSATRKISLIK